MNTLLKFSFFALLFLNFLLYAGAEIPFISKSMAISTVEYRHTCFLPSSWTGGAGDACTPSSWTLKRCWQLVDADCRSCIMCPQADGCAPARKCGDWNGNGEVKCKGFSSFVWRRDCSASDPICEEIQLKGGAQ